MLYHIAYGSASREPMAPDLLADILEKSVRNNLRDGITGVLLYHDQSFFQVLEGEQQAVQKCYARIIADERHVGVLTLWSQQVETRAFGDWAMGYGGPDALSRFKPEMVDPLSAFLDAECPLSGTEAVALSLARRMYGRFKSSALLRAPMLPAG